MRAPTRRFRAGGSLDPRGLIARLWQRFVDSGYDSTLDAANRLDDQYELIAGGAIPESERPDADAEARAIADDLVATQLLDAPLIFDEFLIGDCGAVARHWLATARDLSQRALVPAAQANARLAAASEFRWGRRAALKTSMHDLLFIRPGEEPYGGPMVRSSWSSDAFTLTLERGPGVGTADKWFEPSAPTVLNAFLCQLVGGDP